MGISNKHSGWFSSSVGMRDCRFLVRALRGLSFPGRAGASADTAETSLLSVASARQEARCTEWQAMQRLPAPPRRCVLASWNCRLPTPRISPHSALPALLSHSAVLPRSAGCDGGLRVCHTYRGGKCL